MRIVWVATKSPWPPVDGGRLLLAHTLEALAARGDHEITLIAPRGTSGVDPPRGVRMVPVAMPFRPRLAVAAHAWLRGRPISIALHAHAALRAAVDARLASASADLLVAEQLQAVAACEGAFGVGVPVVLRAQNVESDLWRALAEMRPALGPWARREAARLEDQERTALRRVALTIALGEPDAARFAEIAGTSEGIAVVPPPFPRELPAGDPLPGEPAVTVIASHGWFANRDALGWLGREVWPQVRRSLPAARLHVFGERLPRDLPGVVVHGPPADSRAAFAAGAIAAVPLRVRLGVRMRILEAWARGLPVVATPEAASGLEVRDGADVRLARSAGRFADAFRDLGDARARAVLVAGGRRRLAERHDPAAVSAALSASFAGAANRGAPAAPP